MRMPVLGLSLLAVSAPMPARAQTPAPPPGPPTVETLDRGLQDR